MFFPDASSVAELSGALLPSNITPGRFPTATRSLVLRRIPAWDCSLAELSVTTGAGDGDALAEAPPISPLGELVEGAGPLVTVVVAVEAGAATDATAVRRARSCPSFRTA